MKKTMTVNLNGMVFHIDEDAYDMLGNYLADVRRHFSSEESPEIMNDIEARIAELFTERMRDGRNVINTADVEAVIAVLGKPNEFGDSDAETEETRQQSRASRRKVRRFYRDPEGALLGGVAAGFAAYVNLDVTLVRILMILLVIIGFGWFIPIYLIIWLITPEAKNAAQRLEMQGEEPTLENIRNYVNSAQFRESAEKMGGRLWSVCRGLLKACFVLVGIVLLLVCIAALVGTVAIVVMTLVTGGAAVADALIPFNGSKFIFITMVISFAFTVILPLAAITAGCIRLANDRPLRHGGTWAWVGLALWVISVTTLIVTYAMSDSDLRLCGLSAAELSGPAVTESRPAGNFSGVQASHGIKVILSEGDSCAVQISAPPAMQDYVRCSVDDSLLHLSVNTKIGKPMLDAVTAYVTAPRFTALTASSAARISASDTLRTPFLDVEATSAGAVDAILIADRMVCSATSAGKIEFAGRCSYIDSRATGAAKTDLASLACDTAYVSVTSAAHTFVCGRWLDLKATSGGEIIYEGGDNGFTRRATSGGSIRKRY